MRNTITFPNLNLSNLGIRCPYTKFENYHSFFEYINIVASNRADIAKIPKRNLRRLDDVSLRQDKQNAILIFDKIVKPLYNIVNNYKYYSFKYFIYDTSTKARKIDTPVFSTYNQASLYVKNNNIGDNNQYKIKVSDSFVIDILSLKNSNLPSDVMWRDSFNGVRRALRFLVSPESMVLEYARWTAIPSAFLLAALNWPLAYVIPFFNKIKQHIHKNMDFLPPELRYYLDLQILAGYPSMKLREFTDDPVTWLSVDNDSIYTPEWWSKQFRSTFSQSNVYVPTKILTLKEYTLARWLWVTDGASRFSKLFLGDEKVKTKFAAALSLDDDELLNLVFNSDQVNNPNNIIGVFIKPDEKGYKRRLIANVQLGFYIVASYIRYVLDQYTGQNPIYMKLAPALEEQYDVINLIRERKVVFPLDESAYDYHVTENSWLGFIDFLPTVIPDATAIHLFKSYFGHAFWKFEDKMGVWSSGMPSGLALTSYLNSWMNYIKQINLVKGYVNWAAGDDVLACPYNQDITLDTVEKYYDSFGSVTNAVKNWTSNRYAEYLKTFYTPTGTSGYPARVFSSILWAGTERFFLPSDRLPELFELFKQFFDRVGIPMPERYVAADLSRAVSSKVPNFNTKIAIEYMHAPRIHGGMGKLPYNDKTFTWSVQNQKTYFYTGSKIRVPRVIKYYGKIKLDISTYKINPNVNYKCGKTFTLPEIKNMEDWEARINREDIDYHGPFQSLILDTIPLPCVDFISTSQMSNYAKTHYYNAFPNLTGSWNVIASRLIKASLALANLICQELLDREIQVLL